VCVLLQHCSHGDSLYRAQIAAANYDCRHTRVIYQHKHDGGTGPVSSQHHNHQAPTEDS